jgi:penicillin-binding protein 1A
MNRVTGGSVPAMIWKEFMTEALKDIPVEDFPKPNGIRKEAPELPTPKQNWELGPANEKQSTVSVKEKPDKDHVLEFFKKHP